MFRVNLGIIVTFFIIVLLLNSNGTNIMLNNSSEPLSSHYSTETDTLQEVAPNTELPVEYRSPAEPGLPAVNDLNRQNVDNIVLEESSVSTDKNTETDLQIVSNKDYEFEESTSTFQGDSGTINIIPDEEVNENYYPKKNQYNPQKTSDPTSQSDVGPQESGNEVNNANSNPNSLYEYDIAGGSWVDSFEDDSGIEQTMSDHIIIHNQDVKLFQKPEIDSNTVALWHFDEGSDTIAYDETDYNNDGTLGEDGIGSDLPSWVNGKFGKALDFDGTDDNIFVKDSISLDVKSGLTIEAWIYPHKFYGNGGSSGNPIVAKWYTHAKSQYQLAAYSGGNIVFRISDGTISENIHIPNILNINQWYQILAMWDLKSLRVFVNGKLVGEKSTSIKSLNQNEYYDDDLYIGYDPGGSSPFWHFDGIIDEIRISNLTYNPINYFANLTSKPINISNNMRWDTIIINKTQSDNTNINVTILNASNNQPIPGTPIFTNDGEFSISYIDPIKYPSIRLKAALTGNFTTSPSLHYWGVSWNATNAWRDSLFGGFKSTLQNLTSGDGELWLNTSLTEWLKYENNPILKVGTGSSWDKNLVISPTIVFNGSGYMMWYGGRGTNFQIGLATSKDGISWAKYSGNPVITFGSSNSWEDEHVKPGPVLYDGKTYKMWYKGMNKYTTDWQSGLATSTDGITWTKNPNNPIFEVSSSSSAWDNHYAIIDDIHYNGIIYQAWYTGLSQISPPNVAPYQIGYAISYDGSNWIKYPNPVISEYQGWYNGVNGMNVQVERDRYLGWYNNKPGGGSPTNIYHVYSNDGINWIKYANNPVLDKGPSSAWDKVYAVSPVVVVKNNQYWMYYTGSDGTNAQIGLAKSKFSSSGSIISSTVDVPADYVFDELIINKTEPADTFINVSIIDAKTNNYITNFNELRNNITNIRPLNDLSITSIKLIANFSSNQKATPILYNWAVTWRPALEVSTGGPYIGVEAAPVQFEANCTTKGDAGAVQYRWDLDNDGYYDDSILNDPKYTWLEDGDYTVKVEAFDGELFAYDSTVVGVKNIPPEIYSTAYVYTLSQGNFSTTIPAIEKAQNGSTFYNYFGASSHTGFEKAYESKLMLYRDITTDNVSLIITHNIDYDTTGIRTSSGRVDFDLSGIPQEAYVAESDDPNHIWDSPRGKEFSLAYPSMEGHWYYIDNTDGGVLDGLPTNKTWNITITPLYWNNVNNWVYHFANGTSIILNMSLPVTISYNAQKEPTTVETYEGTPITLGAFARDWGVDDEPLNYTFNWNDPYDSSATGSGTTPWDTLFTSTHTYFENGTYYPVLTVTDSDGATDSLIFTVIVNNVAPTVNAGGDMSANEGAILDFYGSFYDPGIFDTHTIFWDFGDGNSNSSTLTPSHSYAQPGVYDVTLTVTDDDGGLGVDNLTITVLNVEPIVNAGEDIFINEGEAFTFNGTIENPGEDTLYYYWDFDITSDGLDNDSITDNDKDSYQLNASHVYMDNGIYTAKLTVIDDDYSILVDYVNITVYDLAPNAYFKWSPEPQAEDATVQFIDSSTSYPDEIIAWYWEFGDGITSTMQNPAHAFSDNGKYTVILTVTDDDSSQDVISDKVTIQNVAPIADSGDDQEGFEVSNFTFNGSHYDPGIYDTHTYEWDFNYDGINFTVDATGQSVSKTWIDDFEGLVALNVTDNDGGFDIDTCHVLVKNVPPSVDLKILPIDVNISVRIAGEKWRDIEVEVYDANILVAYGNLTRHPGNPDEQRLYLTTIAMNLTGRYSVVIRYTPEDDPVNCKCNPKCKKKSKGGATPCWLILNQGNSDEIKLHHTFKVKHPNTHIWKVNLTEELYFQNITFEANVFDPGADDLTFFWDFGDGTNMTEYYPNQNQTYPVEIVERVTHYYSKAGTYKVTLTVTDDDFGEGKDTVNAPLRGVEHWCGYIAYEDLKNQNWCDYDYNDWGMLMQVKTDYYYDGKISDMELEFVGMLKEAGYNHRIHLGIGMDNNVNYDWDVWHYNKNDEIYWHESGSSTGDLNITLFNYTGCNVEYFVLVQIKFLEPVDPESIAEIPFDPYMYVFNIQDEIHIGYNQIVSIKDACGSNPFIGQNESPLILVIELDGWMPPKECQRIWKAYPYFDDWIFSKRTEYLDWYKYPA